MKVIADINGWKKVFDISRNQVRSGSIEVMLCKPLDYTIQDSAVITVDEAGKRIRLFIADYTINSLPVFKL
jgi:hypothetical protein